MQKSIWSRLFTAIRGGANEVGEAIADSQALRILDQEIRDADSALATARSELAKIMAKEKISRDRLAEHNAKIAQLEVNAIAALDKGLEDLAHEVAAAIATLTHERDQEAAQGKSFAEYSERMRKDVARAEARIKSLRQQVDMAKARESVQKAQVSAAIAGGGANAKLETAVSTLARLQKRQEEKAAELEAQEQLADAANGNDLQRKLQEAGIVPTAGSANSILESLRNRPKA